MAENEPKTDFICVAGGPKALSGTVAISEVHPEHPFVPSTRRVPGGSVDTSAGEHQVFVVKDDPKTGWGWAARTAEVQRKISYQELVEITPPSGAKRPQLGPPTESSERVAGIEREQVGTVGGPTLTEEQIEAQRAELDKAQAELAEYKKAESERVAAAAKAQAEADKAAQNQPKKS
jgi:hypothetical protein